MSISFVHRGREYFAIVRHRTIDRQGFFVIRIMNNKLDALLNKHQLDVIKENDGMPMFERQPESIEQGLLINSIASVIVEQWAIRTHHHSRQFETISDFRLLTLN